MSMCTPEWCTYDVYTCSNPPSDTNHYPTVRAEIHCGAHRLRFWLVGEPEPELSVDLGLVGRVGVAEHGGDVAECRYQVRDFWSGHPARTVANVRAEICFGAGAFGLGLGDPFGNHHRSGNCTNRHTPARCGSRQMSYRFKAARAGTARSARPPGRPPLRRHGIRRPR